MLINNANKIPVTFGTNPTGTDDITLNYYSNVDIINALNDRNVGSTATVGFYDAKMIYRKLNNAYIRSDYEVGTAFIGLENKHVEVFIVEQLTLTDIKITRDATSTTAGNN